MATEPAAAGSEPASADQYDRFLTCYENVARDEKWRSKGPEQLGKNEIFAAEVANACRTELVPFQPMLRKRLDNAFASAKLTPDATLIETGMTWVTVRAILADWPKIRHRIFPPQSSAPSSATP